MEVWAAGIFWYTVNKRFTGPTGKGFVPGKSDDTVNRAGISVAKHTSVRTNVPTIAHGINDLRGLPEVWKGDGMNGR